MTILSATHTRIGPPMPRLESLLSLPIDTAKKPWITPELIPRTPNTATPSHSHHGGSTSELAPYQRAPNMPA